MTLKDQGHVEAHTDCLAITAHVHSNSNTVITVIVSNHH